MRELMKQMFADETLAVSDQPTVQDAHRAFEAARGPFETVKQRVAELDRLCMPVLDSSDSLANPPARLAVLRAQAELPAWRLQLWEAEAALEQARTAHQCAVAEAVAQLERARHGPRKAMIGELFTILSQAQALAQRIHEYDMQTALLGGTPPRPPVPELLSDQYRPSFVQFTEEMLRKEAWL